MNFEEKLIEYYNSDYEKKRLTIGNSMHGLLFAKKNKENLKLVKLSKKYKKQLFEMMEEWSNTDEKIIPYAIRKNDYHDFDTYLKGLIEEEKGLPGLVPSSTYFCLDTEKNIFIGAVSIRHNLNESLLKSGGHIGDGIRPYQRSKGLGTKMIALALEKCREMNIEKVLMVCDKSNIASSKTIIKNGGVLENEINENGNIIQRYWIDL